MSAASDADARRCLDELRRRCSSSRRDKIYGAEPPVVALDGVSFSGRRGELRRDRRPVRVGQVDAAAPDGHARAAEPGRGADHRPRRRRPVRPRAVGAARDADRLRLPAVLPRRARDRARERRRRAALRRRRRRRAARARSRGARARSGSRTGSASGRPSSRAASASASRSRARSSAGPRSCSPTSRPATSTAPPAPRSSRCSRSCTPRARRSS